MIETKVVQVSAESPDPMTIQEAARVIRSGGLVCFPTETVYGLGADALSEKAVRRVFAAKGRPVDNPLIVHIADPRQIFDLADENLSFNAEILASTFWPGPLTLVMRRTILVPNAVTAGLETVAIRMPDHRVALALINEVGRGIVGPSANLSGRPSPTLSSTCTLIIAIYLTANLVPGQQNITTRRPSSFTRRRIVRLSPIAQDSSLLPPVGEWTVSQFHCGRSPSQAGYPS